MSTTKNSPNSHDTHPKGQNMPDIPETLEEGVEVAKALRTEFDTESKKLKHKYLSYVTGLKNTFGTSYTARALGVSRHRVYQIEQEAAELAEELGL